MALLGLGQAAAWLGKVNMLLESLLSQRPVARETVSPLHGLTAVSYLMKAHALGLRWAILDVTEARAFGEPVRPPPCPETIKVN